MLPLIPVVAVDAQSKFAPPGTETRLTAEVEEPEQTVCGLIMLTVGFGLTLTTKVMLVPVQLFNVGVIVYVTVPWVIDVVLNV